MANAPGSDNDDGQRPHDNTTNNGPPNDDLVAFHFAQIDAAQGEVEKANAVLRDARKELRSRKNKAKGDLKYKIKHIDAAMAKRDMTRAEQRDDLEALDHLDRVAGNVTWQEADLFAKAPDAAKDELDWEGYGYTAGKRGAAPKAPEECPPAYIQAWLKGHARGADELMRAFSGKQPEADGQTEEPSDGEPAGEGDEGGEAEDDDQPTVQ